MTWLALDIGGANIKLADGQGYAAAERFDLWKQPAALSARLAELIGRAPQASRLAITMTGELCDCYPTRTAGVIDILSAVRSAADGREVFVYLTDGRLAPLDEALQTPLLAAAGNWRALAQFAARFAPEGAALLIDVGSTTTDLVPIADGALRHQGVDDASRMMLGELVYTGVSRTPLCAVAPAAIYRGRPCPLAAEWFATTHDVYLTLGSMPEEPQSHATANGRPATVEAARDRLARQLCLDRDSFTADDARHFAESMRKSQIAKIGAAGVGLVRQMGMPPQTLIISGQGEFLARLVALRLAPQASVVSLNERLGERQSVAAPAHALAVLAAESSP
ncbi:MAG: hydantoinase/oxoprolinase family protein [Pirellulales bacterium]